MATTKAGPIQAERLKSFIERIEKLEEERKAIGADIKDVYSEAKGVGYDVKTVRWVVQERRMDAAARAERDALRDVYQHALDTAVGLVRGGLSLREAGRITGASKSSIHRALAVPAVSHPESSAGPDEGCSEQQPTAPISPASRTVSPAAKPVPDGEIGAGTHSDEAGIPVSVGAVAAEPRVASSVLTPHVTTDDDLTIPAHLRGPSPANRRVA